MKKKKVSGKLNFSKSRISNLDSNRIMGGGPEHQILFVVMILPTLVILLLLLVILDVRM
ncbi:class I lanthipeptide [Croceiramulus getboli]